MTNVRGGQRAAPLFSEQGAVRVMRKKKEPAPPLVLMWLRQDHSCTVHSVRVRSLESKFTPILYRVRGSAA